MRFMLHVVGVQSDVFAEGEGPSMEEFMAWDAEAAQAGVRVDGGFYAPWQEAVNVVVTDDAASTSTGPVAGSTEYLGGFAIIDVPDLETATEWAARNPGARFGRVEVRPVFG